MISSCCQYLLLSLIAIITAFYAYCKWIYHHSENGQIPCVFPPKFLFGNLWNVLSADINYGVGLKNIYCRQRHLGNKIARIFMGLQVRYLLTDIEYIKSVLQGDFEYFTDRDFYYNEKDDPLSANLFALGGQKWSLIRNKLSPTFTAGKLKAMFDIILQCGLQMQEYIDNLQRDEIEITEMSASYSIDVIGSCAFGINCNCFKNSHVDFKTRGKEIFEFNLWRVIKVAFSFTLPNLARRMGVRLFGKSLTDFFVNITRGVIRNRLESGTERKDMIQLLMELHNETSEKGELNFEEITAQVFIFFAAGFETSSITLTYCLYELSINEDIQDKLRQEINEVVNTRYNGSITYDAVMEMKYMAQVLDETLRKHSPVPMVARKCVKDYKFAGTDFIIRNGSVVIIPILGLHHDPTYFPNPDHFDPERFSDKNKQEIPSNLHMPFGGGPRICIGLRFALIQLKVALTTLLLKYKFSLNERTVTPIPVKTYSFTLMPANEIYLNIERLK